MNSSHAAAKESRLLKLPPKTDINYHSDIPDLILRNLAE